MSREKRCQEPEMSAGLRIKEMSLQHGWCRSTFYRHILVQAINLHFSNCRPRLAWVLPAYNNLQIYLNHKYNIIVHRNVKL